MKILIATLHRSIVGGVETYLQGLIPALLQRGHEVAGLFDHPAAKTAPVVDPPQAHIPVWYTKDLQSGGGWREISQWRPDVVYSQGIESLEVDRALQDQYPMVTFLHGYWGTCPSGTKSHAFPVMQPCTKSFGPGCLLLHYPRRCGGLNPLSAIKTYGRESARNRRLAEYEAILVASKHMSVEFQKNGVPADRLHVLRLPIAVTAPSGPPEIKDPVGARLLFLGRLTKLKGVDVLIRAMPAVQRGLARPATLTIAGDGSEAGRLKDLVRRLGVDARFVGWADGAEKLDLMRQSDLLVVPSLWPEPFGMVGIEAGSVGLPAAGFAVGGIPDWLVPSRTGELAPADPPTAQGLAEAIVRALADPRHYSELCRGASHLAKQFSLERHIQQLEQILIARSSAARPLAIGI